MSTPESGNVSEAAQQEIAMRLAEFHSLRERGALCTELTDQLATEAATAFLNHFRSHGDYLREAITLLAEIATLEEPCLAQPGQQATFPFLVEYLSDSFDPQYCALYDRALAQMIALCRPLPGAQELDAALRRFGLESERDLLERKARLREKKPMRAAVEQQKVRRVLVLSRVTLGAEVAVTSIVLQKEKWTFPQAERVLLGSAKVLELFGGDSSFRLRDIRYETSGGLLDRLQSWLPVLEAVEDEIRNLRCDEYVMIDPDSRLLQLGLLPALRDESRYFFFESRRFGEPGLGSISQITLRWLNSMFGGPEEILPVISLKDRDRESGQQVCRKLRQGGSGYLVAANFGVGGNPQKRFPDPLEEALLFRLLEDGCTVLLDKGFGEEEIVRANRLVGRVKASGWSVMEMDPSNAPQVSSAPQLRCQMLTWQGAIGPFSALVAGSDQYVGYDSAGQHIAAALGVPTLDIFTASASPVFRERWRPTGPGIVKVVAEAPSGEKLPNLNALLSEVMALHREIKSLLRL